MNFGSIPIVALAPSASTSCWRECGGPPRPTPSSAAGQTSSPPTPSSTAGQTPNTWLPIGFLPICFCGGFLCCHFSGRKRGRKCFLSIPGLQGSWTAPFYSRAASLLACLTASADSHASTPCNVLSCLSVVRVKLRLADYKYRFCIGSLEQLEDNTRGN